MLFGLKAPVVKCHGSSDAKSVYYTIKQIRTMLETDVVGQLVGEFSKRGISMTNGEIFARLSALIKQQLHDERLKVGKETVFHDDLGMDSIALVEFIITLEDEFNLDISDEDVEDIQTVGELTDYLEQRL